MEGIQDVSESLVSQRMHAEGVIYADRVQVVLDVDNLGVANCLDPIPGGRREVLDQGECFASCSRMSSKTQMFDDVVDMGRSVRTVFKHHGQPAARLPLPIRKHTAGAVESVCHYRFVATGFRRVLEY